MLAFAVALTLAVGGAAGGYGVLQPSGDPSVVADAATAVDPVAPEAPDPARSGRAARGTASGLSDADGSSRVAAVSGSSSLPAGSGTGRRVVFSEGRQRVWLVGEADGRDAVERTYLVSGSIYDNLEPGTYEVFSRSRHAIGIDDSGMMEFFVRFTFGDEGAAIGFHSIPVDDGAPVQTLDELGTPLSHGCVRQARADAIAMWDFAPLGTTVVVTP